MFADAATIGAIVYLSEGLTGSSLELRSLIERVLSTIGIPADSVQAALFRAGKQGKWRKKLWPAFDEAMAQDDVEVLDLLVGTELDVRFTAKLQLRRGGDARATARWPLYVSWVCETKTWPAQGVGDAARLFLSELARIASPLSGAIFRAPTLGQAMHEIHVSHSLAQETKAFQDRIGFDMRLENYWTKARRLYPITLLGPKLASGVTAAQALAAGALAVQELGGSLLIDAYPTVVETWDPEYLRATVELRRWLWPHSIQNPADAVGLGLKLPRR